MRERINAFVTKVDQSFGLENYDYVLKNSKHEAVRDAYRRLGPFDHFEMGTSNEEVDDAQRVMNLEFDVRKSGALYRGQVTQLTQKPDGFGFKVYPNGSIFEGYFEEGQINGHGRGVTHRGEIY